jgi:ribonuclease BN (tRNA processing enzyme)
MTTIYILGAGTPTPTPARFGSAYVVQVADELVMFDCGPAATHKLVKAGLSPTQINHLFFTHHHFDHDVDYPCFLLCRWDQGAGRIPDLQVFGPTLTERITHRILDAHEGAFAHDWIARVNAPISQQVYQNRGGVLPRRPPSVEAKDVGPGLVYEGKDWRVSAAPAVHAQPWLDSLAYRLDSDEGSIVITGDTEPCDSVTALARGADVMLCMCWDDQERMVEMGEAPGQCGTNGAAEMAQAAGVKQLVLVHMGPHISTHGPLEKGIGDVRARYDGQVIFAEELMQLQV